MLRFVHSLAYMQLVNTMEELACLDRDCVAVLCFHDRFQLQVVVGRAKVPAAPWARVPRWKNGNDRACLVRGLPRAPGRTVYVHARVICGCRRHLYLHACV